MKCQFGCGGKADTVLTTTVGEYQICRQCKQIWDDKISGRIKVAAKRLADELRKGDKYE